MFAPLVGANQNTAFASGGPTYSSGEIGVIDSKTVEATFSEDMASPGGNAALGSTITVNEVARTIDSATIQADKTKIRFNMTAGINGDDVLKHSYSKAVGDLESDVTALALEDVTAQTLTNTAYTPSVKASLKRWYASDDPDDDNDYSDWSDDDAIGTLADKSASGSDFVQSTTNLKPLWKTGQINTDLPAVVCDVDDLLENTDYEPDNMTLVLVYNWNSTGNKSLIGKGTFGAGIYGYNTSSGGGYKVNMEGKSDASDLLTYITGTGVDYIVGTYATGGSRTPLTKKFRVNGTERSTVTGTGAWITDAALLTLGKRNGIPANSHPMAEVMIFDEVLSGSDLTDLETYLANKYGV